MFVLVTASVIHHLSSVISFILADSIYKTRLAGKRTSVIHHPPSVIYNYMKPVLFFLLAFTFSLAARTQDSTATANIMNAKDNYSLNFILLGSGKLLYYDGKLMDVAQAKPASVAASRWLFEATTRSAALSGWVTRIG